MPRLLGRARRMRARLPNGTARRAIIGGSDRSPVRRVSDKPQADLPSAGELDIDLCQQLRVEQGAVQLAMGVVHAQLLAEAYLALTSGQGEIGFEPAAAPATATPVSFAAATGARPRVQVSPEEQAAHAARLARIAGKAGRCVWNEIPVVGEPEEDTEPALALAG